MAETRKQLFTTEYETYVLGCRITTDASGDPTLSDNVGVSSVSKTATGTYKVVLKDKAARLVDASPTVLSTGSIDINASVSAHDVDASSPYVTVKVKEPNVAGSVTYTNPDAADLVSVVAALDPIADGALSIAAQPDYPRKLQVRIVDADSSTTAGTVTLVGVGCAGEAVTQTIDFGGGGTQTVITDDVYATLTSATVASEAGAAAGDTIGIGVATALGLPIPVGMSNAAVSKACVDADDEAVGTVDATAMSIVPTTAPNATHDYDFYYSAGGAADLLSGEILLSLTVQRR